ncbi:MAG: glycosyltransferase family 2 protein [Candidatus Moranbacteria bacterium]|nr:glycosyltransferase family 2 protein [Candidatus Moranbacteria bacterium]
MEQDMYLSVIIPAYKEQDRIGQTLLTIEKFLRTKGFPFEVLVVIDGASDATGDVARGFSDQISNLRVIENKENHGKGYVVRQGLLEARGKYRLFMDADGSTSIDHVGLFLPAFEQEGYDVVIGSRDIAGANIEKHQAKYREMLGNMGNIAIKSILGLWEYPDTQCGFKMLSAKASEAIASRMVVDRFGFDFELLALAHALKFRVKQLPVRWVDEAQGSTVKLFGPNGYLRVLRDLFATRLRLLTGRYRISEYKQ